MFDHLQIGHHASLLLVGCSFILPPAALALILSRGERSTLGIVPFAFVLLAALPLWAGWLLHEAHLSGHPLPYAAVSLTSFVWGAVCARVLEHRRIRATRDLMELRIRRLERLEAQVRLSDPEALP